MSSQAVTNASAPKPNATQSSRYQAPLPPRSARWAKASSSANCYGDLDLAISKVNPEDPRNYWICLCQVVWDNNDEEKPCDGGKEICICTKPADNHPNHIWVLSAPGKYRFFQLRIHCEIRDPNNFRIHSFNDHEGMGVVESVQNLLLDYDEVADDDWKGRWAICEALAHFMHTSFAVPLARIDNPELATWTYQLLGRMFLRTLAEFENRGTLGPNTEVRNLGVIMALWMSWASFVRENFGSLQDSEKEALGPKEDNKTWFPHKFDNQIFAYARKYDIKLVGPYNISKIMINSDASADFPVLHTSDPHADPFGFAENFASYVNEYTGVTAFLSNRAEKSQATIGGDYLDLTSWTTEERRKLHFRGADPLPQEAIDAIKKGFVLQMTR